MSKLAVEINKSIRRAVKAGKRGFPRPELDDRGEVTGMRWIRACYCVSRGLMKETDPCPRCHRPIGHSPARKTLEKLIDV